MIFCDYHIAASRIPAAGQGLFIASRLPRGAVVVAPAGIPEAHVLRRTQLDALSPELVASSIRWFEDRFTIDPEWGDECYINHSFAPNGLWHLGFVFALRDLEPGDELTIDYRLLLGEGDTPGFRDALTGHEITGFRWQESLRRSAADLLEMLSPQRMMTAGE